MHAQTTRFGSIEVKDESIMQMPEGLLGFEECKRFVLLEEEPDSLFRWFQSLDQPELAFILINPLDFYPDYDVELSDEQAIKLGLDDPSEAVMFTTVSINREKGQVTTNLLGPIVFNIRTLRGKQLVLQDDRYSTKCTIGDIQCPSLAKVA